VCKVTRDIAGTLPVADMASMRLHYATDTPQLISICL
jgi:hypothetical protein